MPKLNKIIIEDEPIIEKELDLRLISEQLDRLDNLIFHSSGRGRWTEAQQVLGGLRKLVKEYI